MARFVYRAGGTISEFDAMTRPNTLAFLNAVDELHQDDVDLAYRLAELAGGWRQPG